MTVLLLDCDGVVVHGHPQGGRWDKDLERDLGLRADLVQTRFFKPHFRKVVLGEADLMDALDAAWPQLETTATPRAFVDYWFAMDSRLDGDVLAQVDAWRAVGRKAYLATVQEHHRARYLMDTLGLARHFDGIHYAAALGAAKPDRAFYERSQALLPPGEVIFLDDSLANVEAATAFGWRAHHFRSADDLRAALSRRD
ncbi:MAG TPA: HAD-IA family hydrolase [Rhizomicrobium sp.]|jgi:putative hydrolase of the HAD superfamily|nr:HAD-IA family hydrolase [Rhizomicrobium sp.]